MEVKQHIPEQPVGQISEIKKEIKKVSWDKWKCMACSKSSSKRKAYSNKWLHWEKGSKKI